MLSNAIGLYDWGYVRSSPCFGITMILVSLHVSGIVSSSKHAWKSLCSANLLLNLLLNSGVYLSKPGAVFVFKAHMAPSISSNEIGVSINTACSTDNFGNLRPFKNKSMSTSATYSDNIIERFLIDIYSMPFLFPPACPFNVAVLSTVSSDNNLTSYLPGLFQYANTFCLPYATSCAICWESY